MESSCSTSDSTCSRGFCPKVILMQIFVKDESSFGERDLQTRQCCLEQCYSAVS